MNKIIIPLLIASLSGCGILKPSTEKKQPAPAGVGKVVVIQPGVSMILNGHPVAITGLDKCPGSYQSAGLSYSFNTDGCMVIRPTDKTLRVKLNTRKGDIEESWKIVRNKSGSRFSLLRPNGHTVRIQVHTS